MVFAEPRVLIAVISLQCSSPTWTYYTVYLLCRKLLQVPSIFACIFFKYCQNVKWPVPCWYSALRYVGGLCVQRFCVEWWIDGHVQSIRQSSRVQVFRVSLSAVLRYLICSVFHELRPFMGLVLSLTSQLVQWFGRWSFGGELSLTCAQSMIDRWQLYG